MRTIHQNEQTTDRHTINHEVLAQQGRLLHDTFIGATLKKLFTQADHLDAVPEPQSKIGKLKFS